MENHPILADNIDTLLRDLRAVCTWGFRHSDGTDLCGRAERMLAYQNDQLRQARERIASLSSEIDTLTKREHAEIPEADWPSLLVERY